MDGSAVPADHDSQRQRRRPLFGQVRVRPSLRRCVAPRNRVPLVADRHTRVALRLRDDVVARRGQRSEVSYATRRFAQALLPRRGLGQFPTTAR